MCIVTFLPQVSDITHSQYRSGAVEGAVELRPRQAHGPISSVDGPLQVLRAWDSEAAVKIGASK